MCRLFGFRSDVPSSAHRSLLEAENALAHQASDQPDGWGIGYYLGQDAYILKADAGAAGDERFAHVTRRLQSHAFVVHVRKATVGQRDMLNTHPFRHGRWVFAHNGTVWGFNEPDSPLRQRVVQATCPRLRNLVFGRTDSEHLFYFLLSALQEAGLPVDGHGAFPVEHAAPVLRTALQTLFSWSAELGQPPPLLNYILTNGRAFFAQQAGIELFLASQKRHCADFDTCTAEKVCFLPLPGVERYATREAPDGPWRRVNHLLVASEPISQEDRWEMIPGGHLLALDDRMHLHLYGPPEAFQTCPAPPAPPARFADWQPAAR